MLSKCAALGRPFAAALVASLAVAGAAVADAGPATTTQVSATFYANTLVSNSSQSCTAAGGDAYQVNRERFTGTASSSDARLAGAVTVDVVSVIDTTKNLGWLSGDLRVATTTPGGLHAHLTAVDVNGTAQGFVTGDGGGLRLAGSFSGTFSTTGGFGSSTAPVAIGSGTGTNTALLTSGSCAPPPPPPPPPPVHTTTTHATPPPPTGNCIPQGGGGDADGDNHGAPSDGDGCL
jgi:hypothetical protein